MAIINMLRKTLIEVVEFVILVEEEPHVRRKNMVRYHQNSFGNDKFEDNDDEDEHYEKKTNKKSKKVNIDTIREGVYCQNCF